MEILNGLIYGIVAGFAEFFPVSALAHEKYFVMFSGTMVNPFLRFFAVAGCLLAVLVIFRKQLRHMQRELRIANTRKNRRLRQPDLAAVSDARTIIAAIPPIIAGILLQGLVPQLFGELWMMALMLILNGIVLYWLQFIVPGTRNSRTISRADGILFGFCSALSVIPGISGIGSILFAGQMRRYERSYLTDLAILISIPWLLGLLILDGFALFGAVSALTLLTLIGAVLGGIASFMAASGAISLMRYFAVRIGFHGFALYSWGIAFVSFILYLMI